MVGKFCTKRVFSLQWKSEGMMDDINLPDTWSITQQNKIVFQWRMCT